MRKYICGILALIVLLIVLVLSDNTQSPAQNVLPENPPVQAPQPEVQKEKPEYEMLDSNIVSEVEAENDATTFPALWGDYTKYLGFDRYMLEMEKCGAVCFYLSKSRNVFMRINYANATIEEFSIEGFAKKWGNTPAQITGEKLLNKFLDGADCEIFLAKPLTMERKIEEKVRKALNENQIKIKDILSLKAEYIMHGGNFCLRVNEILYRDSSLKKIEILVLFNS